MAEPSKIHRTSNGAIFSVRPTDGINTQAHRTAIKDTQFSWLENIMPVGMGNFRAVLGPSAALATLGASSFNTPFFGQVNSTPYLLTSTVAGGLFSFNINTNALTRVGNDAVLSASGVFITVWKAERFLIIDPVKGYFTWNGVTNPIVTTGNSHTSAVIDNIPSTVGMEGGQPISGSGIPASTTILSVDSATQITLSAATTTTVVGLTITVNTFYLISSSVLGTSLGVFAGRVWIANGRTVRFTDADSFNSFAGAGGSFILTDSTLLGDIVKVQSALGGLWIFALNGINVLNGVSINSGVTVFNNTNIVDSAGTTLINGTNTYLRTMMMVAKYGVFAVTGVLPEKISDDLDGIFQNLDFTQPVSVGVVTLFNQPCFAISATYNDPLATTRKILMVFFAGKWFVAAQGAINQIVTVPQGNSFDLYAVDNTNVYKLFASSATPVITKIQSKLFDLGEPIITKEVQRVGVELQSADLQTYTITADTENSSATQTSLPSNQIVFIGAGGTVLQFTNNSGPFNFSTTAYLLVSPGVSVFGKYFGTTLTATMRSTTISNFSWQVDERNEW